MQVCNLLLRRRFMSGDFWDWVEFGVQEMMCEYALSSVFVVVVEPVGRGKGAGCKLQNNSHDYDYSRPVICHAI